MEGMNNYTNNNDYMMHNLVEHVVFMKKELDEYKIQNKVNISDLEKSLNSKCAISQLEDLHNKLVNEINRKISNSKNGEQSNVSKEFLDDIMKKLNDIKTADLLNQDRMAKKNKER